MIYLETISLCLAFVLCVLCTRSDIRKGVIYNKILVIFFAFAVVIDGLYYGIFAHDIIFDFIPNVLMVAVISLYLFYTHSFAGGDCKMTIVLSLLYPARCYLVYGTSIMTLFFALGFAIFAGYIYLFVSSVRAILTHKVQLTLKYIKTMLLSFIQSYIAAMAYITLANCILLMLYQQGIPINVWFSRGICLLVAWLIGKCSILKKWYFVIPTYAVAVVISIVIKIMPISLNPESYVLVLILLLCQMTIKTTIYEKINIDNLGKGMILSTFSSVLMQTSITKGLPAVSTEDLKSRLTDDEVNSIKIWARATHTDELTIVKKIPFAIFISIGFVSYFILWSILV